MDVKWLTDYIIDKYFYRHRGSHLDLFVDDLSLEAGEDEDDIRENYINIIRLLLDSGYVADAMFDELEDCFCIDFYIE